MNYYSKMILRELLINSYTNQRQLAKTCKISLGVTNRALKELTGFNYIDSEMNLNADKLNGLSIEQPKRAIILAAGYGMRMVPIGGEVPKALLCVRGEILIERQIEQLKEVGINEIYIVVGYLKEMFDYLVDKYDVKIIYNMEYASKNNLYSLALVSENLGESYIVPCDLYAYQNPFSRLELDSWYMLGIEQSEESTIQFSRKGRIRKTKKGNLGNRVLGIAYLNKTDGVKLTKKIASVINDDNWNDSFWEEVLLASSSIEIDARIVDSNEVIEVNTYTDLMEIDSNSQHLNSSIMDLISENLKCDNHDVRDIHLMKKGMTNRSFRFKVFKESYIMRIPGEGTSSLINRFQEAAVYDVLKGKDISDDVIYFSPDEGYKITRYWENTTECDPFKAEDVKSCMEYLRTFHNLKLKVDHCFNLFEMIDYYENLWTNNTLYKDYSTTKKNVFALKDIISQYQSEFVLTHIDAVPDNFLFTEKGIRLIDWEYAGMQDPHVDIAMFAIYSLYNRTELDSLIDIYFEGNCNQNDRIKIYCYVAVCGLLWSNWCEYKRMLGVEFGEYSVKQYRFAKDYSNIVNNYINGELTNEI